MSRTTIARQLADRALLDNHGVHDADTAAMYLDGVRWLIDAWPEYLRHSDPGGDGHERVAMFLSWSLGELAKGLQGVNTRDRLWRREAERYERTVKAAKRRRRADPGLDGPRPAELSDTNRR